MQETVIELDLSVPWEPPEPPAPQRRLRARWVAVAAVLAVTLGLLVAGGPSSGAGLLYTIDHQVLRSQAAGGRLFVARYQPTGPGSMIEGRRLSDGRLLWEREAALPLQLLVAGSDVVILMSEDQTSRGDSSAFTVLDAATGKELWSRAGVRFNGSNPGVVIVEDPQDYPAGIVIDKDDFESGVNRAGPQPLRRIRGLAARTGSTLWDVTVPAGSDVNFSWENPYQARLNRFDVLSRTGQLTRLDARTGAVTETHQLDRSGAAAWFSAGWLDGSGRPTDRVIVYPDGQRGATVYDVTTGRQLFRWAEEPNRGLYQCTDRLLCAGGDEGLDAFDSTTGARRWHLDGHSVTVGFAGDRLLAGSYRDPTDARPGRVGIIDSRTGTVVKELAGWQLLTGGDRPVLWRPVDNRTALLGQLDPATGLVTVFTRAGEWYGNPECSIDDDVLVCVVVGGLSVWRLPNRA
ncbi:PQQ-binding-like beta-propeller repeat protein [Dactylosporangium sp. NBC_01737]|uniref:outer membrane protein assembly factor BamB family protein n=1 Tax=Dactylosporangium sp. NBC_01737 TaxID=2975959 RepID=UPI002E0DA16A|nr:PQQ-binding-like beta-propeller repeat protein [Dactylosporangium sp. NBC_01737]